MQSQPALANFELFWKKQNKSEGHVSVKYGSLKEVYIVIFYDLFQHHPLLENTNKQLKLLFDSIKVVPNK